jgi:membrane protein
MAAATRTGLASGRAYSSILVCVFSWLQYLVRPWPLMLHAVVSGGRLVWRAFCRFNDHKGPDLAAAISYYTLLTLIPLLIFTISLGSLAVGSFDAAYGGATLFFRGILEHLSPAAQENLRLFVQRALRLQLPGIVLLAWTSKRAFGALASALETIFGAPSRGFARGNLFALGMVFVTGAALLATIALTTALATVEGLILRCAPISAGVFQGLVAVFLTRALPLLITLSFFFYLYRVVPRRVTTTRYALAGALLGTGLWELARQAFTLYLRNVARYAGLYGTLEAIIVLALWLELSASIILFCGEIVALLIESRVAPSEAASSGS